MTTTRWRDEETFSLDEALALLLDKVADENKTTGTYWQNMQTTKVFDENKVINLNGRDIYYNLVKCSYDQIGPGFGPIEDRVVHKTANIIAYSTGSTVRYIITQNTRAKKLLRMLLSYTGRNEIVDDNYQLTNDFFIWLINKVYRIDNVIEPDNDNLSCLRLDTIKGFKGDVEDEQTKVSASGESVMNVISALSFLLESKRLKQIKLDLQYGEHENLSFVLKNNSVSIDFKFYQGKYEQDDQEELLAKLYLLMYLEILPIIEQEYQSNVDDGIWDKNAYINFMKTVAGTISKKIEAKIKALDDDIVQYNV